MSQWLSTELSKLTVSWALGGLCKSPCSAQTAFVDLVTVYFFFGKEQEGDKTAGTT